MTNLKADEKHIRPAHYRGGKMEVWDVIDAFGLGFDDGNVAKYLLRARTRGKRVEDIRKALTYLTKHLNDLERDEAIERDLKAIGSEVDKLREAVKAAREAGQTLKVAVIQPQGTVQAVPRQEPIHKESSNIAAIEAAAAKIAGDPIPCWKTGCTFLAHVGMHSDGSAPEPCTLKGCKRDRGHDVTPGLEMHDMPPPPTLTGARPYEPKS